MQTDRSQRATRAAVLGVLAMAVAAATLYAASVSATPAVERVSRAEAKRQVRMMDQIYKSAVVTTHKMYVQDPGTPAAVIWAKQVINQMKGKGWPDARIIASHDRPLNPENSPTDKFERDAIAAFQKGRTTFEVVTPTEVRYATDIRIVDEKCLLCHVRNKTGDLVGGVSYRVPTLPAK
jgi:hypothetical protein